MPAGLRRCRHPVVHAVTSDEIVARADFLDVACAVMRALGARGALHLRAGRASGAATPDARGEALSRGAGDHGRVARRQRSRRSSRSSCAHAARSSRAARSASPMRARAAPALALGASVHSLEEARGAARAGARLARRGARVRDGDASRATEGRGLPFVRAVARGGCERADHRDRRRASAALRGAARWRACTASP